LVVVVADVVLEDEPPQLASWSTITDNDVSASTAEIIFLLFSTSFTGEFSSNIRYNLKLYIIDQMNSINYAGEKYLSRSIIKPVKYFPKWFGNKVTRTPGRFLTIFMFQ
jgi:hypothetical protein